MSCLYSSRSCFDRGFAQPSVRTGANADFGEARGGGQAPALRKMKRHKFCQSRASENL